MSSVQQQRNVVSKQNGNRKKRAVGITWVFFFEGGGTQMEETEIERD